VVIKKWFLIYNIVAKMFILYQLGETGELVGFTQWSLRLQVDPHK